ncbi:MAG: glycosyltransferase [Deltaproteobacteria bacterium]|nr:glycosyltransferase [Deltaproteobacteria bacterium]
MRVLLLCQLLPYPADSGTRMKTWNLVRWLGARTELTLVGFARDESHDDLAVLRRHCSVVHTVPLTREPWRDGLALGRTLWSGRPWVIERDRRRTMHALVRAVTRAQRFDVVHIDQLTMAQYAGACAAAHTVLDLHDVLSRLSAQLAASPHAPWQAWLWRRDCRRLRAYERSIAQRVDTILTVSQADRRALAEVIGPGRQVTVLPIGIDVEALAPLARADGGARIVYIGTMFWPPNAEAVAWFLRAVWPRIRAARPDAQFAVIGARPPRALRAAARGDRRVSFHGYVADPAPLLAGAAVTIAPLRSGSGMRVKILTALAQELPVVTTSLGCEGIDVVAGRDALIADTPEAFAAATLRLLDDAALGRELGRNGRRLIEARYDYRSVLAGLEPIYGAGPAGGPRSS